MGNLALLLLVFVTCVALSTQLEVTAGTCTKEAWVEYLGMTRQETGSLQIGYTTEADCRARCEALTTCVSYDFDPPAIFGCSFYEDNLVDRLDDHPTINHYQLEVTCVLQDAEQTTCTYKYVGEYTFVDASIAVPAETVDEDTCLRACTQNANCLSAAVLAGDVMPCTLSGDPLVYDNSRTTDPGRKQYEQIQCTRQDTTTAAPTTAAPTTASTTGNGSGSVDSSPGDITMDVWCHKCANAESNEQCNSHFKRCGPRKQACQVKTRRYQTRISKKCIRTSHCQNPDVMTCDHNGRRCSYCCLTPGCNDVQDLSALSLARVYYETERLASRE